MDTNEILNELENFIIIGTDDIMPSNYMYNSFAIRNGTLVHFDKESEFNHYLYTIYSENKIEQLLISRNYFKEFIIDAFIDYKIRDKKCDISEELRKISIKNYHVLLPIYYVQILSECAEIKSISFIKYQSIEKYLQNKQFLIPKEIKQATSDNNFFDIPFVDNIIMARDTDYALEQAKIKLDEIVRFLNFVIYSNVRGTEVISSTTDYNTVNRKFIFSEDGCTTSVSSHSPLVKRITIDDIQSYLSTKSEKEEELFELINLDSKNEMEKRLNNAINWVGMAVAEKDNSVSFTQAMYGIESLLQYEQKGEIINKSVVASIAESTAFLLGHNFEERKKYEKRFKELYGIRSKIAHGKSYEISAYDVLDVIELAKSLIMVFYKNSSLKEAKTMLAVTNYISKLKYSCLDDKESK